MAQTLSVYDPIFYAQEALIALEKSLGMASRVYRGYEKAPQQRGSIISITVPSVFTAQSAPATTPNEIIASEVQIALTSWKEVRFALTDKELTYTTERIVRDHIRPAAYAIADAIDQDLCALYKDVPYFEVAESTAAISDLTNIRKIQFNAKVPMDDLHLMVNGTIESELLQNSAFTQWQGSGQAGVDAQLRGYLGTRFGYEIFANQNVKSHTGGVCADAVGAATAGFAAGIKTITVGSMTAAGTLKIGDPMQVTGHTQGYVLTADTTLDGAGAGSITFEPGLTDAIVNTQVVTVFPGTFSGENLAFHRNAFALGMAPLSELGNQLGAKIATITDPVTGLSLRSRMFYDGTNSKVLVGIDALYGVKTLDRNLACRLRDA